MTVKQLSTLPPQYVDGNGNPYSGARLFYYQAGTSTKQNVYTDSTGGTPASNPTTLNSSGYPVQSGTVYAPWGTVGQTYKILLAAPGSDDPPSSSIWSIDNVTPVNDISSTIDQWVASGLTPTYVSGTSFTVTGDQTSTFSVGRRLKTTNTAGTIYSRIKSSAYASVTTVTVVNDSGVLDSGLSAVSYGLLTATNPSTPLLTDAYPVLSGSSDKTKLLAFEVDTYVPTATTVTGTVPGEDWYVGFRNCPVNSQIVAYTTVLADSGKFLLHPTADNNARTFTIDSNANVAYPIGTCISFVNQINTVTIAITSDTMTLAGTSSTGSRTLAANGVATAIKVASTAWYISGSGLS